jgi:hypothetical protein
MLSSERHAVCRFSSGEGYFRQSTPANKAATAGEEQTGARAAAAALHITVLSASPLPPYRARFPQHQSANPTPRRRHEVRSPRPLPSLSIAAPLRRSLSGFNFLRCSCARSGRRFLGLLKASSLGWLFLLWL